MVMNAHCGGCTAYGALLFLSLSVVVASKQKRVKRAMAGVSRHHLLELHTSTLICMARQASSISHRLLTRRIGDAEM